MIRVGTRIYSGKNFYDPEYPGFTPIICLTKSTPYGSLGPYVLKDENGVILENRWQFSKAYTAVPATKQTYSRFDPTIIWEHPAEIHLVNGLPTEEMLAWRQKGFMCPYPVRYPVGKNYRGSCVGSITQQNLEAYLAGEAEFKLLDYITARKEIYWREYQKAVVKERQFKELRRRLQQGENLLIIEVDGPIETSLPYYREKYGVEEDFIEESTMLCTERNIRIMLNDPVHAFGHAYCLSAALQGFDLEAPPKVSIRIIKRSKEIKNTQEN